MSKAWQPEQDSSPGAPAWMVTFSDMVTLLLCFFILLFSMSHLDNQKLIGLMNSMSETFNPRSTEPNPPPAGPIDSSHLIGTAAILPEGAVAVPIVPAGDPRARKKSGGAGRSRLDQEFERISRKVAKTAQELGLEKQLHSEITDRGVVISFAEVADDLRNVAPFESGSARLRPEFKQILSRLAPVLRECANKIEVQGHTDPRPIHTAAFPSNWELSGARAGSVVRFLTAHRGLPGRQFVCTGFADTIPVDPRNSPQAWARNRRVEIVVTRQPIDTYDKLSRADATASGVDITQPLGDHQVRTGLPGAE